MKRTKQVRNEKEDENDEIFWNNNPFLVFSYYFYISMNPI